MMIEEGQPLVTKISRSDQAYLYQLAGLRNDPKEELGITGKFDVTSRAHRESHFYGLLGEFAVASVLGVEIDETLSLEGDKHRPDLVWNGWGVEVKVARYAPPILKFFPDFSDFGADMAVLCFCEKPPVVEIHGFLSKKTFKAMHYVRNFGWGDRACVDAELLSPMSALNGVPTKEEWYNELGI